MKRVTLRFIDEEGVDLSEGYLVDDGRHAFKVTRYGGLLLQRVNSTDDPEIYDIDSPCLELGTLAVEQDEDEVISNLVVKLKTMSAWDLLTENIDDPDFLGIDLI